MKESSVALDRISILIFRPVEFWVKFIWDGMDEREFIFGCRRRARREKSGSIGDSPEIRHD